MANCKLTEALEDILKIEGITDTLNGNKGLGDSLKAIAEAKGILTKPVEVSNETYAGTINQQSEVDYLGEIVDAYNSIRIRTQHEYYDREDFEFTIDNALSNGILLKDIIKAMGVGSIETLVNIARDSKFTIEDLKAREAEGQNKPVTPSKGSINNTTETQNNLQLDRRTNLFTGEEYKNVSKFDKLMDQEREKNARIHNVKPKVKTLDAFANADPRMLNAFARNEFADSIRISIKPSQLKSVYNLKTLNLLLIKNNLKALNMHEGFHIDVQLSELSKLKRNDRDKFDLVGDEIYEKIADNVNNILKPLYHNYVDSESDKKKIVDKKFNTVENDTDADTIKQQAEVSKGLIEPEFEEDQNSGYKQRTIKNASADVTLAIAVDFSTAGERLTKNSVVNQNKVYVPVDVKNDLNVDSNTVQSIVKRLNDVGAESLNIAGNGIYTMKGKYTQQQVDEFVYNLLNSVLNSPNLNTKIISIRSGGQTGFDEAGTKAGIKLGLPTLTLAPKGWKFRDIDGRDISNETQFKERFSINVLNRNPTINKEKEDISTVNIFYGTDESSGLSNLALRPFTFKGKKFQSVEHAYQSLKSGTGLDKEVYDVDWSKGGLVKRGSKGTKTVNNWNVDKLMKILIKESFDQNPEAKELLLATGTNTLTHTQDKGVWKTEFPRLLTEYRNTLEGTKPTTVIEESSVIGEVITGDKEDTSGYQVLKTLFKMNKDFSLKNIGTSTTFGISEVLNSGSKFSKKTNKVTIDKTKIKDNTTISHELIHTLQYGLTVSMLTKESKKTLNRAMQFISSTNLVSKEEYSLFKDFINNKNDNNTEAIQKLDRSKNEIMYLKAVLDGTFKDLQQEKKIEIFMREFTAIAGSSPEFRSTIYSSFRTDDKSSFKKLLKDIVSVLKNVQRLISQIIAQDESRLNSNQEYIAMLNLLDDVLQKNSKKILPIKSSIKPVPSTLEGLDEEDGNGSRGLGSESTTESNGTQRSVNTINLTDDLYAMVEESINEEYTNGTITEDWYLEGLEKTLMTYMNTLKELGVDKSVEITEFDSDEGNMRGTADPVNSKIAIVNTGNKDFFNKTEVLLHEPQHILIHNVIKNNRKLQKKIKVIRESAYKALNKDGKGYEIFLYDKAHPTSEQVNIAKKLFSYAFQHDDGSPESEFMAYATTNKYVMRALRGVKIEEKLFNLLTVEEKFSKSGRRVKTIYDFINSLIDMINKIYAQIKFGALNEDGTTSNTQEIAHQLMSKLVHEFAIQEKKKTEPEPNPTVMSKIFSMEKKFKDKILRYKGDEFDNIDPANMKLTSLNEQKGWLYALSEAKLFSAAKHFFLVNNLFASTFRDTTNEKVAWFYDMFNQSKKNVEADIVKLKSATIKGIRDNVGMKDVDVNLRKSLKRVLLDTDYRSIDKDVSVVAELLADESMLDSEIEKAKKGLNTKAIRHSEVLGKKIATGNNEYLNSYMNSHEIYYAFYTNLKADTMKDTKAKIDKLASLYALKNSGVEDKALALEALTNNKDIVQNAMNIHYLHVDVLKESLYYGDDKFMEKVQKQESFEEFMTYKVVSAKNLKALPKGYKSIGKNELMSEVTGMEFYNVIGANIEPTYNQGGLSVMQLNQEGLSLRSTLMDSDIEEGQIDLIMERLTTNNSTLTNKDNSNFNPVRSTKGNKIRDYRIRLSQAEKEEYMGINNDITETIANSVANFSHKEASVRNNMGFVDALRANEMTYRSDNPKEYILLRATNAEEKKAGKEYKYADKWAVIPSYTKEYISETTGENELWVHRELLQDFIGNKDFSITEIPIFKKFKTVSNMTRKLEMMIQEVVARNKKIIVLFTGSVIGGNLASNAATVMEETHWNPKVYTEKFAGYWEDINQYHKDMDELTTLISIDSNDKDRMSELEANLKSNPVHVFADDGQLFTIIEDIDASEHVSSGLGATFIRKMTAKLPKPLQAIQKQLYLDDRTLTFKAIQKLTVNADLISKLMIHEFNMENKLMTERQSLRYTDQKFINYSHLDNRFIKYVNDIGAFVFTKFLFRTLPGLLKHIIKNPLTMGLFEGGKRLTGIDIGTPIDGYLNPIDSLFNRSLIDNPMDMFTRLFTPTGFNFVD